MVKHDSAQKRVTLENKALRVALTYADGVRFEEFSNIPSGRTANREREAFVLTIYGHEYTSRDFTVKEVKTAGDQKQELVTFLLELPEEKLALRLHLISDREDTVSVLYQFRDGYKLSAPSVTTLHLPLLAGFESGAGRDSKHYPSGVMPCDKGDVMQPMMEYFHSADILLPLVVSDENEKYGFSVGFPSKSDLNDTGATQNVNKLLTAIDSEDELIHHLVRINPDDSFNDTVELKVTGIAGGWAQAFDRYRDEWQSRYDFAEYGRPDLKWIEEGCVHNFVFLYGKEGFDHEKQEIDVDGLIKQGEAFGGYDTVAIWNQYPRLGIDKRTQWDFYDDFPGGRKALRAAVKKFHDRGVKVLLPYIPWDRGNDETTNTMGDEFARIVADTDADGYQLDTMRDLPFSYRKKLDDVKPGLLLQTQHHPLKKHPVEFITSSWDEFWRVDPMPEADVFRFICPQHIAPVISRWLRLEDKWTLIKRCEFGAAPIVIWQDIFGRWMPFTEEQKARIKTWKATYMRHRAVYQGKKPIPLLPTGNADVYCNLFVADEGGARIYSFYSHADAPQSCTMTLCDNAKSAEIVLGNGKAALGGARLTTEVAPKEVLHVLVK